MPSLSIPQNLSGIRRRTKQLQRLSRNEGRREELQAKLGAKVDVLAWVNSEQRHLLHSTAKIFDKFRSATIPLLIEAGVYKNFNGGYLFLKSIYHKLGIIQIYKETTERYNLIFDIDAILLRLVYDALIIHPASKLATVSFRDALIEKRF